MMERRSEKPSSEDAQMAPNLPANHPQITALNRHIFDLEDERNIWRSRAEQWEDLHSQRKAEQDRLAKQSHRPEWESALSVLLGLAALTLIISLGVALVQGPEVVGDWYGRFAVGFWSALKGAF